MLVKQVLIQVYLLCGQKLNGAPLAYVLQLKSGCDIKNLGIIHHFPDL